MNNANEETRQLSPEEYRVEVLKRRFADKVANYEDEISGLLTQVAHLQQQLRELQEAQSAQPEAKESDETVAPEDDDTAV